jgi:hypothetical protein
MCVSQLTVPRVWAVIEALKTTTPKQLAAFVVKSTVLVGTGARVRAALDVARFASVGYASNPEFHRRGQGGGRLHPPGPGDDRCRRRSHRRARRRAPRGCGGASEGDGHSVGGDGQAGEAERWAPAFRQAPVSGPDPAAQDLYAARRLFLRPGMHRWLLDRSVDITERAHGLLDHIGHGNLPHSSPGFWNTTAWAAFHDTALEEVWQDHPSPRPSLHVVFQILPLPRDAVVSYETRPGFVAFTELADIPVQVAGMSWRTSDRPWDLHTATFTPGR